MLKAFIKTIRAKLSEQDGTTMVELLVSLTLTAILITAATFMMTSGIRAYNRSRDMHSAISVSNLILDKVTGELTAAKLPVVGTKGYYVWLDTTAGSPWITYNSKFGIPAAICLDNAEGVTAGGYLCVRYYQADNSAETFWHFDPAAYMGFEISELTFTLDESTPGLIRADLTLCHKVSRYEYSSSAYALPNIWGADSSYICLRNDGQSGIPEEAEEFAIIPEAESGEVPDDKLMAD